MATPRLAVVTGSSGGIGLEVVRGIAHDGENKVKVILTARNKELGEEAARRLNKEGLSNVVFHQLDITDPTSISTFVEWIKNNSGGLDILVNNAGTFGENGLVIETNYGGTKRVTEALLGCMNTGARIINVSSSVARLDILVDEAWKQKLLDTENLTEQLVDKFVEEYLDKLSTGREHEIISGFTGTYSISKMALNGYSQVLAKRLKEKEITVMCMCPGHTSTKMTLQTGHSPALGADTAVWLATAPADGISTGKFYVNRKCVESLLEIPCFCGERSYQALEEWNAYMQVIVDDLREIAKKMNLG